MTRTRKTGMNQTTGSAGPQQVCCPRFCLISSTYICDCQICRERCKAGMLKSHFPNLLRSPRFIKMKSFKQLYRRWPGDLFFFLKGLPSTNVQQTDLLLSTPGYTYLTREGFPWHCWSEWLLKFNKQSLGTHLVSSKLPTRWFCYHSQFHVTLRHSGDCAVYNPAFQHVWIPKHTPSTACLGELHTAPWTNCIATCSS